jgi:protein TonB
MDAAKQWNYKPYLLNGEAVEISTRISVDFFLNSGKSEQGTQGSHR